MRQPGCASSTATPPGSSTTPASSGRSTRSTSSHEHHETSAAPAHKKKENLMSERISVAVSRRAECGEGPIWDAAANAVHWVDIIPGEILITDFATGETRVTAYPDMVGAIAPRRSGGVVAAVTSGFVALDT